MGRAAGGGTIAAGTTDGVPHAAAQRSSRSRVALDQDRTLIAVIEMSQASWLVAGLIPGVERHPLKKLKPDEAALLRLLHRWRTRRPRLAAP